MQEPSIGCTCAELLTLIPLVSLSARTFERGSLFLWKTAPWLYKEMGGSILDLMKHDWVFTKEHVEDISAILRSMGALIGEYHCSGFREHLKRKEIKVCFIAIFPSSFNAARCVGDRGGSIGKAIGWQCPPRFAT